MAFPKFLMLLKSHALSRIFYRTYNQFSIISLISQNRYAAALIISLLPCNYLILQVFKHMSPKTIPNMPTALLNSLKLMQKPITLMPLMTLTKLLILQCLHLQRLIMKLNNSTLMDISAMLINSAF